MKRPAPRLLLVPYQEVRHDQPDDCLHYEPVSVRAQVLDWTIPAHHHEGLHQFQFLAQGALRGSIDSHTFEAAAPALLMMAPGAVHGFSYAPDAEGHQLTLPSATLHRLLEGSQLAGAELGSSFVVSGLRPEDAGECAALFAALAREFRASHAGRVHALQAFATLLAVHFLRRRGEQFAGEDRPGARDALVQRYLALVAQHYREHQPLAFYAERLGVTPDHLSRVCRNLGGQAAQQVLHERLLLEARRLLAYTPMPVAEVAAQLGYEDAAYFSKFFARSVGHTPSRYRRLVAEGVRGAA